MWSNRPAKWKREREWTLASAPPMALGMMPWQAMSVDGCAVAKVYSLVFYLSQEQLLNVMLAANTREVSTPQRGAFSTPRASTAPAKPARHRHTHSRGDDAFAATSRTHGGGSLAEQAAIAAAEAVAEMSSDDEDEDEGWAISRPRGLSSTAESREVRRSSMTSFDEDRERSLTGATPDLSYDGKGGAITVGGGDVEHVMRDDSGQGSRTNSGWKWDFAAWHSGSKSGNSGAIKGRKRPSKS